MANATYYHQDNDSFGPAAIGRFDFTLLFEDAILSIAPSCIFLLLLPLRLLSLRGQRQKVAKSTLHETKLQCLYLYVAMQLSVLVVWSLSSSFRSRASIPAAGLEFVVAIGLCYLSHIEHIRSVRPSSLINAYLLLTLPFDIARCRTMWLSTGSSTVSGAFTSTVGVKLLILITEAIEKRDILLHPYQNTSPESTSGIYSRSMFWWLNTLMRTGFRRVLVDEDLYPADDAMASVTLQKQAQSGWESANRTKARALFWSIVWTLKVPYMLGIFPRLCLIGFRYAQPLLISRTINYSSNLEESSTIGWALTGAFGLVLAGQAISNGSYYHMVYRYIVSVRGALVGLIYGKTLDLSITALDESAAVTLMATDTEAICNAFQNLHELWATPLEAGIAFYLLYLQLGAAFIGPTIVVFISTAGIMAVAKRTGQAQKCWIEGIQTRVDVTGSMLGSMKGVKMLGFTDLLMKNIQNFRVAELNLSIVFRKLLCFRALLANSTSLVSPFVTFVIFVIVSKITGRTLDTAAAYAALSLIAVLQDPVNTLIRTIPELNAAFSCFARIQKFLLSDARKDHRLPLEGHSADVAPQNNNDEIELQDFLRLQSSANDGDVIVLKNATFAWAENADPVIHDVSLSIRRAQFTFIIGPVGSGKSTLLKGLLAEVPSSKGFVYTSASESAFVDQTPWIQNGTLQENILGVSSFEEGWYNTVVYACSLEQDINIFPKGHHTAVGSGGISLSGGQKQRVALARAIYARKDVVLLDDVFSGLDATTEEQIFTRLLGKQGLLRMKGTTVLLVTHAVQRLPFADHIVALTRKGQIAEQGSFAELKDSGGYVHGLATKHKAENEEQDKAELGTSNPAKPPDVSLTQDVDQSREELNRKTGEFAVYKYYFATIGWKSSIVYLCFVLLTALGSKLTQLLLTYWTAAVGSLGNEVNGFYLGMYGMLTVCGIGGLMACAWHFLVNMVPRSAEVLHAKLLRTVMDAPLSFFSSTDMGQTLNRFSQDMTVVDLELPYSLIDLCLDVAGNLIGAILMCISASYFSTTMPPVILILWVLQKYYLKTSRQIRLLDLEAKSPLYSHFMESLLGLSTIRAFGWTQIFREQNLTLLDTSQRPYYLLFCIQRWLALILDLLVAGLAVILMVLVVKLREEIGAGFVGLALLNVLTFNTGLSQIIKNWTSVETSIGAIARLRTFGAETASENLSGENQTVPEEWPVNGVIEFKNVTASYSAGSSPVLRNFDLKIRSGEKIGICGRSGSGKSSLIMSLFRMLEISPESAIFIDGIDITTLPRQQIRSRLNAIPQEPFFIKGTIRENADPMQEHTDDEIVIALRKVQLWDLISDNGGLDAVFDMEDLSHGQRQLFCLARAILKKSQIVVLDEATSSVDVASDSLMQTVIRTEFSKCTIIAVAHRLDTILDFDRVALLGDGKLIECDAPATLLAQDSKFKELYLS